MPLIESFGTWKPLGDVCATASRSRRCRRGASPFRVAEVRLVQCTKADEIVAQMIVDFDLFARFLAKDVLNSEWVQRDELAPQRVPEYGEVSTACLTPGRAGLSLHSHAAIAACLV